MISSAELLTRAWRRIDVKIVLDGEIRLLRWRRGWLNDALWLDDRKIAEVRGLSGRETVYGLVFGENGREERALFTVDAQAGPWDWSGESRPRGVRIETADRVLPGCGALYPAATHPFKDLFDAAVAAMKPRPADRPRA